MSKLRILVVDDDRDFAESLAEVLRLDGHEVDTVYTGERALERFRQRDYDLTFLDVKLPGRSGVERFLEMRKLRPHARVFMTTGFSVQQLLDHAIASGASGVLQKPLDPERLLEMVNRIKPQGVLVADDDPDLMASVRDLLEGSGYQVCVARDGRKAIDRVLAGAVDILILDLRMPVLNGLEVYLELKRQGRSLPTIIVTAYAREEAETLDKLRTLSVTGILTKPFDPAELLAVIEKLAGEAGL
jgi:two-component system, NtrC family, response regulator HydG